MHSDEGTSGSCCDIPKRYVMHAAWGSLTRLIAHAFIQRYAAVGAMQSIEALPD